MLACIGGADLESKQDVIRPHYYSLGTETECFNGSSNHNTMRSARVVLAGLNERRRELAVLRAVGAGPRHVLWLLALEGALVTLAGALLGALAAAAAVVLAGPWLQQQFGITLLPSAPTWQQWGLLGAVLVAGMLASLVPGWRAYRLSLADGLSPRT